MGVIKSHIFHMYRTPRLVIKKSDDVYVMNADPKKQARILCAILATAVPCSVMREFAELIGGDPERIFDIGNLFVENQPTEVDIVEAIRSSKGTVREIAAKFNVSKSWVHNIRSM